MFALTKAARIKRQLIKLYKADHDLAHTPIPAANPYYEELNREKITIERKKIALSYDLLKVQLIDWSHIDSLDSWKLYKPQYSEGTAFTLTIPATADNTQYYSYPNGVSLPAEEEVILSYSTSLRKAKELNAHRFLYQGIYTREKAKLEKLGRSNYPTIANPLIPFIVEDFIKGYEDYDQICLERPNISSTRLDIKTVVKHMHTNIIFV